MTELDDRHLRRLLQPRAAADGQPGWRCPDAARLSAFVDQRLPERERHRVEDHLAGCSACLDQVAFLVRRPESVAGAAPAGLLARARDLVTSRRGSRFPTAVRWASVAAAACLVLLVFRELGQIDAPSRAVRPRPVVPASIEAPARGAPVPAAPTFAPTVAASTPAASTPATVAPATAAGSPVRAAQPVRSTALRNTTPAPAAIALLSPREDATVPPLTPFRWQAAPGALYYEIQVLTDEGSVVWQDRTESTSARMPDDRPLQAGARYYVKIRACLSDGGQVGSEAVAFIVGGR